MPCDAIATTLADDNYTMFIVCSIPNTGATAKRYAFYIDSNTKLHVGTFSGNPRVYYGSTDLIHPIPLERGSNAIITARREQDNGTTFANGAQIGSGTTTFGGSTRCSLGSNEFGGQNGNTMISELVFVKSAMSVEDRQLMEGYLAHKWDMTSILPSDHPYKTTAPTGPDPTYAAINLFDTNGSTETRLTQSGSTDTTFITADAGIDITVSGFDTYVMNYSYPLTIRLLIGTTPTGPWNLHAEQVLVTYPVENQMLRFDFIQTTFRYFKLEFTNADFDFVRMNTFQFLNQDYILYHPQSEVLELFDRNNTTFCVLEGHTSPTKTSFIEVDLGGSITVNRIATRMTTTGYPTVIRMYSGSPGNYNTLVAEQVFSTPPPVGQHPTLDFPDTTMTHVRFELSGVQDDTRVILVKLDLLYIEPLGYIHLVAPTKIEAPFVRINCFNTQTEREVNIELNEIIMYGETIAPVVVALPVQTLVGTHRYLEDSFDVSVRTDSNGHIVKRITKWRSGTHIYGVICRQTGGRGGCDHYPYDGRY
jgi:hypothetical protein